MCRASTSWVGYIHIDLLEYPVPCLTHPQAPSSSCTIVYPTFSWVRTSSSGRGIVAHLSFLSLGVCVCVSLFRSLCSALSLSRARALSLCVCRSIGLSVCLSICRPGSVSVAVTVAVAVSVSVSHRCAHAHPHPHAQRTRTRTHSFSLHFVTCVAHYCATRRTKTTPLRRMVWLCPGSRSDGDVYMKHNGGCGGDGTTVKPGEACPVSCVRFSARACACACACARACTYGDD